MHQLRCLESSVEHSYIMNGLARHRQSVEHALRACRYLEHGYGIPDWTATSMRNTRDIGTESKGWI